MSPVHVLVGASDSEQAAWAGAFAGAVDLYCFDGAVSAFERLTAAREPIDLVVLLPETGSPFTLSPDAFVARVLESTLSLAEPLAGLHVVSVGRPLRSNHPRAAATATLDAAIRLVKFGELQSAPMPILEPVIERAQLGSPHHDAPTFDLGSGSLAGSIIARIWQADEPAQAPAAHFQFRAPHQASPLPHAGAPGREDPVQAPLGMARAATHAGGVGCQASPQLFARQGMTGFGSPSSAVPGAQLPPGQASAVEAHATAPTFAQTDPYGAVAGGGAGAVAADHVGAVDGLEPSRAWVLPNRGEYRGPAMRHGSVHGAGHAPHTLIAPDPHLAGRHDIAPPMLATQVQQYVYGSGGMVADPVLGLSSATRQELGPPAPGAAMHAGVHTIAPDSQVPAMHAAPAPAMSAPTEQRAAPSMDALVQRAENDGGVSFG